jgi:hypothetical protein
MAICHCEHESTGRMSTTTICLCVCHSAIGMAQPAEPHTLPGTGAQSFDYAPPHGTSVPSDIFRPPLVNR